MEVALNGMSMCHFLVRWATALGWLCSLVLVDAGRVVNGASSLAALVRRTASLLGLWGIGG